MTVVVDASVAIKWVLLEGDSDKARALLRTEQLIAPDFLLLECSNVLAQQVRRGRLTRTQAEAGLRTVSASGVRLVPAAAYVTDAQRIAIDLAQSAYDSLYLTVALAESIALITADIRFAEAARPAYGANLRLL